MGGKFSQHLENLGMSHLKKSILVLLTSIFAASITFGAGSAQTNFFGFAGPEVYPIDAFIGQLQAADLDGDGLNDLIIVNNSRAKINLLYNQTGKPKRTDVITAKKELNDLPPDARFRIDSIASEKRISSLVVADLNGDGRPDLAYYGEPRELVVQYNNGTNGWSTPKRYLIDDGQLSPNALAKGDLNGDGRTDLVLLGDNNIYFLAQQKDHTLAEPEKIPYSGAVKSVQVLDVDGDGKEDLLLVNWDSPNPFRFRLQNKAGQLGPEIHFSMSPVRSYWADDLDGNHKTEIITIALNSGRAQIYEFNQKAAENLAGNFQQGQFQILPLNKTSKARRGMTWADVNGDGLPDLLVAESDSGQLVVYLQQPDGTLGQAKAFPTLTGVSDIAVIENGGGNPATIYLLSSDERQVGVTRYEKGDRVAFPTALPLDGKPLSMAVGKLKPQDKPTLAVILDQDGKRLLYTRSGDGKTKTQKLNENFKSNPSSIAFHDVNQDGRMDLVVLIPYEKIKIMLQQDGKDFNEVDVLPPGGSVEQPWLSAADVDGDGKAELLLAQKNFVRAVVLKQDDKAEGTNQVWSFTVKDQISGSAANSRIVGAAPLKNGTNAVASLFLLDAERKSLTLCERSTNGVWQIVRNMLLPFTEFSDLRPVAIGGKTANSLTFMGLNAIAWMPFRGQVWELGQLDGYETPIKDGQLHDVVSGDLNQDGRKDLVFLETAKNYLDLVIFDKTRRLVPATRWQVFEERTFRGRRTDSAEPREALIVDVTGDKKNDLVVVVHDRILVYPQE
ncbi:MAG: repeat protein [Verrucomicrobiales bacterium]|nr:repeat protein [Verrucomicrobiales bacterium]